MNGSLFRKLAWATTGLALIVIVVGAWVRLTHAGLGCPDWPGCYGMITWPSAPEAVDRANQAWGHLREVEGGKAFREMFHRYLAGILGLMILALAVIAWRRRGQPGQPGQPLLLPNALLLVVIFQAALGMWTVTLLLKPAVVTAHLIGGMTTLALLLWLALRVTPRRHPPTLPARAQFWPVVLTLIVISIQIVLGGWVSTNYAALACSGFPTCNGQWFPAVDPGQGFQIWRGIGVDYEGGVLDHEARVAIQLAHRLWAIVVVAITAWLITRLWRAEDLRRAALVLGSLLLAQLVVGVWNVIGGLPLANAVAHNGLAALILGILVIALDKTSLRRQE